MSRIDAILEQIATSDRLHVVGPGRTDDEIARIAAAIAANPAFKRLGVYEFPISDASALALAGSIGNLVSLYLHDVPISDASALALAGCMGNLVSLKLAGNGFTDVGGIAIAQSAGRSTALEELIIFVSPITDASAPAFAEAIRTSSSLLDVEFSYTNITDHCVREHIIPAIKISARLRTFKFNGRGITSIVQLDVQVAFRFAREARRMMALQAAALPGEGGRGRSAAERFVMSDGDTAIAHRVMRFMLPREPQA